MKIVAVSLAVAALVACSETDSHPDRPRSTVAFDGTDALLYVDVADEPDERSRGLMGVDSMPTDQGMAFVWDEPVGSTFWMKDTLIPLSIAFVGEDDRVIGVRDMQPCEADPCPSYGVDEPYLLAIEANLGWFDDHGIGAGDQAELRVSAYG
ncbi:MAG TPA: DUF192 domain-containing protein [Actinomycetota bacterium]|nr:DUF192 domain-containing protein [Actinomycetota bacterium]